MSLPDFCVKGSDARVEQAEYVLTVFADDEFKLDQVQEIINAKLIKRGVDIQCMEIGKIEKVSGNKVKRTATIKTGVESELAKKIVKIYKESKLKVQASIQGDSVRVSGAKRDTLQEAIALAKKNCSGKSVIFFFASAIASCKVSRFAPETRTLSP